MAEAENDPGMVGEAEKAIFGMKEIAAQRELESLLSGEADSNDCYLEVNAGAGGTEAQDWAEMLLRMYVRWAEKHGYKAELLDESRGEEAGIKSATVQITGHNAYGWLKTESGVHRLVRISPYDSNARRHTSFASAAVSPVIDDSIPIEILDKDLKVDVYRASGAVVSTSIRLKAPCALPIFQPALSWLASRNVRRSRTGLKPWKCSAPNSMSAS